MICRPTIQSITNVRPVALRMGGSHAASQLASAFIGVRKLSTGSHRAIYC